MAKKAEGLNHTDCRNFVPVDVAKGICGLRNEKVLIDTPVCEKFDSLPKCKNCVCFGDVDEEGLGVCKADEKRTPWTYADLPAVTCGMYKAK